uniref:C1q domain-containing protein n=1 Tax=Daphnia galeata TaxID=27404 RepID=A0A8J2WPN8_9CRUS|nr:unnamed protein product [Daphnia galeata]
MNTLAVAALILTSSCAAASPQLWDWDLFANFPDYYAALVPASEQQGHLSTNNLLNQNVDYAATLALMSLVMCVKETKAITQRLEEAMAASIGNLTKELNETSWRLADTNDIVTKLKKELNETRATLTKEPTVTWQNLENTTTFGSSRIDLSEMSDRMTETNATVSQLKKTLAETSQRLANTTFVVENLKRELTETRANLTRESAATLQRLEMSATTNTSSNNEMKKLSSRLAEMNNTIGNLTKKMTEITQQSSKDSQRLVETNAVVGKMKNELAGTSQRLVETNVIVVSLKKELTDTIKQESDKALRCCTNTKTDLTKELKATWQRLDHTDDAIVNLKKEMNETAKRLAETNTTAGNVKDQIEPFAQAAALQHLIETNIIIVSSKKELAEMSQRLTVTNDTIGNLKKELLDTKTKVGTLTSEFKAATREAASIGRMPNSCEDLQEIGHRKSGLYSVMGMKQVETLYCDFTKIPDDENFQKWVGFNDVKSTPTYFHVSRAIPYNQTITPIPFTRVVLNQGGAMNKETGKFTAPVAGIYHFYFTGTVFLPVASASFRPDFTMCLFKNSNCVEMAAIEKPDEISTGDRHERISLQSTICLKQGDQIWLAIGKKKSPGAYLVGDALTNFKGFLIEEDFSQSLNTVP